MSSTEVPPWGQMDEGLLANMASQPVPPDWISHVADGTTAYQAWLDATIKQIATTLWPLYDANASTWKSPSVTHLFNVDFGLLEGLHAHLGLPIRALFSSTVTHSDFFGEEDDNKIGFGLDYSRYDPTLAPLLISQFRNILRAGYVNKAANIDLQLKRVFQRPRPWQMAFIQNRSTYQYRFAATADTPSLVSGHCLQGLIGVCNIYAELGSLMNSKSIAVLEQFAADIGDRRVFAGVHYPSDSLSSWYTASTLLFNVFKPSQAAAVKRFMRNAIEKRSAVYAAIKDHIAANRKSPYKAMVEAVEFNLRPGRPRRPLGRDD